MNEKQWLVAVDSFEMMQHLRSSEKIVRRKLGRKLRLFAVACCRLMLEKLAAPDEYREVLDLTERYAEGSVKYVEFSDRRHELLPTLTTQVHDQMNEQSSLKRAAVRWATGDAPRDAAQAAFSTAVVAIAKDREGQQEPKRHQAQALRDIFGNPFRPSKLNRAWLSWQEGTVRKLAKTIYQEKRFDEMPILGDALEEAGCRDLAILNHCRAPGRHFLGCWVLDLLLERPENGP